MLGVDVVGSNLKMVEFFLQNLWMLHNVVVAWKASCNTRTMLHKCLRTTSLFITQHAATR